MRLQLSLALALGLAVITPAFAANGQASTKERYAYCEKQFSEMRRGWLGNGCRTSPYGRSAYLKPAWDCLCLN